MAQPGEPSRSQGKSEDVHSFHKTLAISYSINIEEQDLPEIQLFPADQSSEHLFQMIFVLKGKTFFKKKGSDKEYGYIGSQQHNLCCVTPESVRMVMSSLQDEVICINLSAAFLDRYLPNHPAWQQFKAVSDRNTPLMLTTDNMHVTPEISAILHRLDQTSNNSVFDQLLLESKTIELLALQISQFEQIQNASGQLHLKKEDTDKMIAARDILISTGGKQLSLRSLAHLVGTNEFNLKRDFKIVFGSTVYNYLNQHKMEQARTMLEEKDVTIAEVAAKMGYKYATHFSSAFKKYFGYLPSTIRTGKLSVMLFIEDFYRAFENTGLLLF